MDRRNVLEILGSGAALALIAKEIFGQDRIQEVSKLEQEVRTLEKRVIELYLTPPKSGVIPLYASTDQEWKEYKVFKLTANMELNYAKNIFDVTFKDKSGFINIYPFTFGFFKREGEKLEAYIEVNGKSMSLEYNKTTVLSRYKDVLQEMVNSYNYAVTVSSNYLYAPKK